jgi:hypothetical protein
MFARPIGAGGVVSLDPGAQLLEALAPLRGYRPFEALITLQR